jgi:hypothetical protein
MRRRRCPCFPARQQPLLPSPPHWPTPHLPSARAAASQTSLSPTPPLRNAYCRSFPRRGPPPSLPSTRTLVDRSSLSPAPTTPVGDPSLTVAPFLDGRAYRSSATCRSSLSRRLELSLPNTASPVVPPFPCRFPASIVIPQSSVEADSQTSPLSFSEKQGYRQAGGAFPSKASGEAQAPPNRALDPVWGSFWELLLL